MKQELIWELMKQAGELAYAEHTAKCLKEGLDPEHTVWSVTGAHYEKFAQLIVAECVSIAQSADDDSWKLDGKGTEIARNIQQHFGAEQ